MSESETTISLSAADYAVFGVMLGVSAAVGFYFAYRDRNKKKTGNYLLGGRKISPWASGFSAGMSFLSGASIIGIPAELSYFGAGYVWFLLGNAVAVTIACEMFLPIYYRLGMSTANEYYGARFGIITRYVATVIYIIQTVAYTGVMIYAPALALNAVSDLSLWGAVASIGVVCTFYTTLGGLKAVIWTDVIQGLLLIVVLFVVLFKSAAEVGGWSEALKISNEGDRLDFFHFEFDPRYRMTFWAAVFGLGAMWCSIASTNQAVVQRFLCCKSVADGKKAIYFSMVEGSLIIGFLIYFAGWFMYAYFAKCDPLASGRIAAADQALPLMVLEVFSDLPGLSGLFITGVFAAALSTISSAINAMTCVTVTDLIKPNVKWSENVLLWLSRGLTLLYGGLCVAFAFLASALGGVIQTTLSLQGLCAGALMGPIAMGTLCTFANAQGASVGMACALAVNIWIYVGSIVYPPPAEFTRPKSLRVDGCPKINATYNSTFSTPMSANTTAFTEITTTMSENRPAIAELYAVSFTYYTMIGLVVCIVVGLVVSCATGGLKTWDKVDPKLINLPFEHMLLRWLPERFRVLMRPKMADPQMFVTKDKSTCSNDGWNNESGKDKLPNGNTPNDTKEANGHANAVYIDDEETMSTHL